MRSTQIRGASLLCALMLLCIDLPQGMSQRNPESAVELSKGLVFYWNFDAGEGDVVADLSGKGNDGLLKSGARWVEGRFGSAVELDGLGASVEASLSDSLRIREALTIAAWVKVVQNGQKVNSRINTDKFNLISGWGRDTRIACVIDGKWHNSGSFTIAVSEWVHLTGTYDKNTRALRLYVNKELKREQILTDLDDFRIEESTAPLRIFQDKADPPDNRVLVVDEVRIYNRALSPAEVMALYQYVPPPSFRPLEIVINEIAWSGTPASPAHEWIELYNNTDKAIDLTDWKLVAQRSGFEIKLRGTLQPRSYYLLEAQSDDTVKDVRADLVYFSSLKNSGDTVRLFDPAGNLIDTANGDGGPWPAGTDFQEPQRASMERIDPKTPDADSNWKTNDGRTRTGRDTAWNAINGTPKAPNSTSR